MNVLELESALGGAQVQLDGARRQLSLAERGGGLLTIHERQWAVTALEMKVDTLRAQLRRALEDDLRSDSASA